MSAHIAANANPEGIETEAYGSGESAERQRLAGLILARMSAPLDSLLSRCPQSDLNNLLKTTQQRLAQVLLVLQDDERPLAQAIAQWCQEFSEGCAAAGIEARCWISGHDENALLSAHTQLAIARTIREATANIVRHSGASTARLLIGIRDQQISIEVRDDGRGRVQAIVPGRGLLGMQRRALALDGRFTVSELGDAGDGLCLRLSLPLASPLPSAASLVQVIPPSPVLPSIGCLKPRPTTEHY